MGWTAGINFKDNITPLDHDHLQQLVDNIEFLEERISVLITNSTNKPLPQASGDGIIRYVVNVEQDMIYVGSAQQVPSVPGATAGGRYFIAVLDSRSGSNYNYHLEIWKYVGGNNWESDSSWSETIGDIQYTKYAWDRCTHDKLYICKNTNKCYFMKSSKGIGTLNHALHSGTTDDAAAFMTETAEAARTIYNGGGDYAIDGWAGYSRSNLLRYRIIIANITVPEIGEQFDSGPLLTVAFNPWFVLNKMVFAPFVKPIGNWDERGSGGLTDLKLGTLRIKDDDPDSSNFYFDAFIGTTKLRPYIHTIIGVADVSVL